MLRIYDKGNWKNFIGWWENNEPHELKKIRGKFYILKMSLELWAIPQWEPLVEWKDFVFWTD